MHTLLGINGTTGISLTRALQQRKLPIRGMSRRPHPGDWEHVQGDILNPADVLAAVDGSETVYLLVGIQYDAKVWKRDWPIIMEM